MAEESSTESGVRALRLSLVTALVLLAGSGFSLQFANTAIAKQNLASGSAVATTPGQTSQVPTVDPVTPDPTDPVLTAIQARQTATGCNFHVDPSVPVKQLGTCKIMVVGDSLGYDLAVGMRAQLGGYKNLKFTLETRKSSGLSNSWFFNWETNLKTFVRRERPNVLVIFLGANDRQNMRVNGHTLTYGTSSWKAAYQASVSRMIKTANGVGSYVVWVGMPSCKPYNYNKGMELISSLAASAVKANHGSRFVALHDLTADSKGNFAQYQVVNGDRVKTRTDDGIHFVRLGQQVIGTHLITTIAKLLRVALVSSHPYLVTK